jgi:hypothetical protein
MRFPVSNPQTSMVEFFGPWVGWQFRTDPVTMQETKSYLGVDLICSHIGLVVEVNTKKEVGKLVENPCRD